MSAHMTSYYMAEELNGERRARHAARSWDQREALARARQPRRWKRSLLVLAVAGLGLGGATASLASDRLTLPDGVINERAANGSGETIPTHPFDGRPW